MLCTRASVVIKGVMVSVKATGVSDKRVETMLHR